MIFRKSIKARNAEANAFAASITGGYIRIYCGAVPAAIKHRDDRDMLWLNRVPGAKAANGVLKFPAIGPSSIRRSGTPSWWCITDSSDSEVMCDGDIGTKDASMILSQRDMKFAADVPFVLESFTINYPE